MAQKILNMQILFRNSRDIRRNQHFVIKYSLTDVKKTLQRESTKERNKLADGPRKEFLQSRFNALNKVDSKMIE